MNQTAYLALSGRTASWQIDSDGNLMLSFADTGTDMSIKRLSLGNDSSTVLQAVATSTDYYISPRLMVKREVPAPSSTASLVGTMLSSAHFITSADVSFGQRSSIDGGLIDNFGFLLNEDGSGSDCQSTLLLARSTASM